MTTGCKSTDSAIKRWEEFRGEINKENICEHLNVNVNEWYGKRGLREKFKANYYFNKIYKEVEKQYKEEKDGKHYYQSTG